MSDTRNVKMGVCRIYYDGVDLGYTKGGVEVDVSTDTHKMTVDQFGESIINEYIMKRDISVKIPLAETTLQNMVNIMPGSNLVQTGGTKATGTLTFVAQPANNSTIVLNGKTITFKDAGAVAANLEVLIGANLGATLTALKNLLEASTDPALAQATYTASATVLTVTHNDYSDEGNAYTLSNGTQAANATASGATLAGGADPTALRVDVTNAVGSNLLNSAKELVLRPIELDQVGDKSEDLIIPKAATAGALQFAYKYNEERIFNVTFSGYPDPTTNILFKFGNPAAA
jgi:hypothetical protein